jgi:hypothetical protein
VSPSSNNPIASRPRAHDRPTHLRLRLVPPTVQCPLHFPQRWHTACCGAVGVACAGGRSCTLPPSGSHVTTAVEPFFENVPPHHAHTTNPGTPTHTHTHTHTHPTPTPRSSLPFPLPSHILQAYGLCAAGSPSRTRSRSSSRPAPSASRSLSPSPSPSPSPSRAGASAAPVTPTPTPSGTPSPSAVRLVQCCVCPLAGRGRTTRRGGGGWGHHARWRVHCKKQRPRGKHCPRKPPHPCRLPLPLVPYTT